MLTSVKLLTLLKANQAIHKRCNAVTARTISVAMQQHSYKTPLLICAYSALELSMKKLELYGPWAVGITLTMFYKFAIDYVIVTM